MMYSILFVSDNPLCDCRFRRGYYQLIDSTKASYFDSIVYIGVHLRDVELFLGLLINDKNPKYDLLLPQINLDV